MLTIAGKALGRKKPLFTGWSRPLPPEWADGDGVTLRQVIERIVRDEVAAFQSRQEENQFLRVLTTREIDQAAETGRISMGQTAIPRQKVDPEHAVGTALLAFDDGLYLVVIDGQEQRRLDNQVFLNPDSQITFVRLTLLAGG